MQTKEYRTVNKLTWYRGEWDKEPDKIQFQDMVTGLPCLIVRNPVLGFLCGYVGVFDDHPLFGKNYTDDCINVNIHGGLTFSDLCANSGDESTHVCHVPDKGEPDHVWWFGFDCGHFMDIAPGMPRYVKCLDGRLGETYKNVSYVKREIKLLAKQLKELV